MYFYFYRNRVRFTAPQNYITYRIIIAATKTSCCFWTAPGWTKCGAILGEAIVVPRPSADLHLDYIIKQKGALIAKVRLLGIQFLTLFKNYLYTRLTAPR
ncbi:hypothetical protein SAMN05660226_01570 [Parapedobacter luteus]|uniref:Uncharacterized protein n=1 Tax=Parapedobacter luteus TaxID=623280 RepID=A0A1T5BMD9_9SPHI|nr:hypothetical protein SAMN05660226_01570 [Parapedobacter luteus]